MQIRWSRRASNELDLIYNYLTAENAQAAARQLHLILDAVKQLGKFPVSGKLGDVQRTRELIVPGTPYIIYYRRTEIAVKLLSIRHGAMRKPRRFRE
jgi:toxin ParE1/3/4